ncbi:MAG TPA: hypothetical protein PKY30_13740, partial [Myxococcota bacterium]|nr:hypothetical protein [Myxococcota bacterium]
MASIKRPEGIESSQQRRLSAGNCARQDELAGKAPGLADKRSDPLGKLMRMAACLGVDGAELELGLGQKSALDKVDADAGFSGKRLSFASGAPPELDIAHELIHARQAQLPGGRMNKKLSQPGDPSEKEAEMLAPRLAKGEAVQVRQPLTGKLSRKYKFTKNDKYNRKNIKGNSGNSGNRPSAVADAGK